MLINLVEDLGKDQSCTQTEEQPGRRRFAKRREETKTSCQDKEVRDLISLK
jgi:hypothetical protein